VSLDLAPVGRGKRGSDLTAQDMPVYPATLWALLEQRVGATPERVLLEDESGRVLTARQWRDTALRLAAALHARGIGPGTPVSWQLPTIAESAILMMALARLGAVSNPIIHILREHEVGFIVGQVGAPLLITPHLWRNYDYPALARGVAAKHGCDTLVIDRGTLPTAKSDALPPVPDGAGNPVRHIYYSSGTTAAPKGVRHTDASLMAAASAIILMSTDEDVVPVAFPFTHVGGIAQTIATLYTGSPMVFFEHFDAKRSPHVMAAHGATKLGSTLPFFLAYAEAQRRHGNQPLFPALRSLASGGAPTPPELFYEMKKLFGVPILANWGLTEFPIATASFADEPDEDLALTEGRPLPAVQVRVVGSDGTHLPRGQEGELLVKGPQMFQGYVDERLNADAFDADDFFRTGDLGIVGPHGHVRITGRNKDIIIRNAENLSALEIEGVIYTHPKVAEVAVIGLPDARTGERAVAVVVLAPGAKTLSVADLAEHLGHHGLAKQKFPEQLEIADALPRNSMGKVLKHELRRQYAAAR